MIDEATFRQNFPEFSSTTTFPSSSIAFWIAAAVLSLPIQTWGMGSETPQAPVTTQMDMGQSLFVAHQLILEARGVKQASGGGIPGGGASGPVSSESVGGVSRSYDTGALNLADAGPWNATLYGQRFLWLARLLGKGPVQLGTAMGPVAQPWFGPPVLPNGWY